MNDQSVFCQQPPESWTEAAYRGDFESIQEAVNNTDSALFSTLNNRQIETMLNLAIAKDHTDFFEGLFEHPHVMQYLKCKPTDELFQILETLLYTAAVYCNHNKVIHHLWDVLCKSLPYHPERGSCIQQAEAYARENNHHELAQELQVLSQGLRDKAFSQDPLLPTSIIGT